MATAQPHFRLLPAILCLIACAACGESSSSLSPTAPTRGSSSARGAVITGRVSGVGLSTSTTDSTTGSTRLRVSISGTNISTMVDGAGQFTLTGVPPGTVTMTFTGDNISASITLNNVAIDDEIRIDIRLNGNSARVTAENRGRRDDDDDDDDDEDDDEDRDERNEVKGEVSRLTGTCPVLTFVAGTRVVITNGATVFDDSCSDIRNGVRVEARGARAADGTFTATRVEVDD